MKNILILFVLLVSTDVFSLENFLQLDTLPLVFRVGEHGSEYEELVANCELPLLELASNSMDSAYVYWLEILEEFEVHADTSGFDVKGVKIWINFFWNEDGSIKHIVFFPKRSSKNINFDKFQTCLKVFAIKSKIKLVSRECFSHFGSASFPTHADFLLRR